MVITQKTPNPTTLPRKAWTAISYKAVHLISTAHKDGYINTFINAIRTANYITKDLSWLIKNKPPSLKYSVLYIRTPHKKYKGPGAVNPYERSNSPIKKTLILL